ncbi:MAG: HlyD family type I secretion periplasmic adaptor subunit [Magnetococcus sp. DMHC-6]
MNKPPITIEYAKTDHPPYLDDRLDHIIRFGFLVIFLFFGVLGGLANFFPMESAVIAEARVVVQGDRKVVQHLEGGMIKKIMVKDGELVQKDQVLFVLDSNHAQTQVNTLELQYNEILATLARLKSERDGLAKINFPPELLAYKNDANVSEILRNQENLFAWRQKTWHGQTAVINKRIDQLKNQVQGGISQKEAQQERRTLLKQEIEGIRALYKEGYASKNRVLAMERELALIEGNIGEYASSSDKFQEAIKETQLQNLQLEKERMTETINQISENQARLLDVGERLRAAKEILDRVEVRASVSGWVVNLRKSTEGGVIGQGEVLMEIVPNDKKLIFEASIRPEDIESITPGLVAKVKLTAYKSRYSTSFQGTVTYVSADSLTHSNGMSSYKILIDVPMEEIQSLPNVTVVPGMPAQITIPSHSNRTILDYLLDPLIQGLAQAFKEK